MQEGCIYKVHLNIMRVHGVSNAICPINGPNFISLDRRELTNLPIRDLILLICFLWRYEATEGPRVNFVMSEALFEIYTWILCRFIPP